MRKLIYVPVIHMSADLGSVASTLGERGIALLGEEGWKRHQEIILGFWRAVADYFDSLEVANFQIFQDGLLADGPLGMKIVEEAANRGSPNFQLIKKLVDRGAQIVKTEDISLLKKEMDSIRRIVEAGSTLDRWLASLRYRLTRGRLLRERDQAIARTINATLIRDGILFIGAHHDVSLHLAPDIVLEEIKARNRLKEYQDSFYRRSKGARSRAARLAEYLEAPIPRP